MEDVKDRQSFKERVKNVACKMKDYFKGQATKLKKRMKNYCLDIREAYGMGYSKGWVDAYGIPKRVGAKTAAAYGYKKGAINHKKSDKYVVQYKHGGKQL